MMIKPWLIRIVGKTKQYISLQVLANWIGLLANIVVTASVARLLGALYEGSFEEGQLSATLLAALAAVVVRIVCTLAASRMSFLASDEVKRILRLSYTERSAPRRRCRSREKAWISWRCTLAVICRSSSTACWLP